MHEGAKQTVYALEVEETSGVRRLIRLYASLDDARKEKQRLIEDEGVWRLLGSWTLQIRPLSVEPEEEEGG